MWTQPKTIETIFALDSLTIDSELELIYALERYIKHNENDDPDIAQKIRPALNYIRFLTLSPKEIARTTLLTFEEIKQVIESFQPDGQLSKMPPFLSVDTNDRAFSVSYKTMIRDLHDVFTDKLCNLCLSNGKTANHAIWGCDSLNEVGRETLKGIYDEYEHTFLYDYKREHLKNLYDIYQILKIIK